MRPQSQERIAIKKIACDSEFPRKGACYAMQGHGGKHQRWSGGRGREVKCRQEPLLQIPWEGMARQGSQSPGWLIWIMLAGSEAHGLWLAVRYMALGWSEQGSSDPGVVLQWQRGQMSVILQRWEKKSKDTKLILYHQLSETADWTTQIRILKNLVLDLQIFWWVIKDTFYLSRFRIK